MDPAADLDNYLKSKGSPMAGYGGVFVAAGKKYGVDPRLLVGISGAESSFGKYTLGAHNAWGWGPGKPFGSWEEGISTVAQGLQKGYLSQGLTTPDQIVHKYAPASDGNDTGVWANNVKTFMREMGAPMKVAGDTTHAPIALTPSGQAAPVAPVNIENLIAEDFGKSPDYQVRHLVDTLRANERAGLPVPTAGGGVAYQPPAAPLVPERVTLAANADRPGVPIHQAVLDFVGKVAGVYGEPLTIGTGTNHNQFVVGTHRESAHWTGWAADVPAGGATLTKLGRAALVAAGMSPRRAAMQRGGLYNLNGYQVIFNSMIGGNHFNHLHVGLTPR